MKFKALVIDFSRVLIFAKSDAPVASLNRHHSELSQQPGYRVLDHFELNHELLDYLRHFSKSHPVYLFTDGALHPLPEIAPALEGIFTKIVEAETVGYKKYQPEAFNVLSERLGYTPADLLFVDDQAKNTDAAAQAGLQVHQYIGNADLIALLDQAKN